MIEVAGGDPVAYPIRTTRWGLVNGTYQDASGASRDAVVEWAALHPELVNFNIFKLEDSRTWTRRSDVVGDWYGPAQNVVVADSEGNIGFTVSGFLPDRRNKDGRAPYGLWDGAQSWSTRPSAKRPRVVNPASGFLHTANNRTADMMTSSKLGIPLGESISRTSHRRCSDGRGQRRRIGHARSSDGHHRPRLRGLEGSDRPGDFSRRAR